MLFDQQFAFLPYHRFAPLRGDRISNAGLATPNPGVNTVQVRLGIGRFFGRHN